MANKQHLVTHDPVGGWNSQVAGGKRVIKHFDNQKEAIDYTRAISNNQGSELSIQGRDGRFREADSHGRDPYPPKG